MAIAREILTSPRIIEIKRKRRNKRIRLFIFVFIFLISIVTGLSFLSFYKKINIQIINIQGNQVVNKEDILNNIKDQISGKYFYLFSKSNIFIYPKSKVYENLRESFPRIEKLSIDKKYFNTLNIILTEKIGSFLWCGSSIPESEYNVGENCFFVNNKGLIFDKAPYFSGNVYFKFYLPVDLVENSALGKEILPIEEFNLLIGLIDKLESVKLRPIYLIFNPQENIYEIYLSHSEIATSPKFIFNKDSDIKKIGDDFVLAMKNQEFADEIRNNYNKLLYFDLRFNNKVLYKFSTQGGSVSGGQ